MKNLTGRMAFVTGGAGGIGLGMAEAFADAGMKVAIADVNDEALAASERKLKDMGAAALAVHLDVRDRSQWTKALDAAEAVLGPLHLLCNNAGVTGFDLIADTPPENFDWIVAVNLIGTFNGVQAGVKRMIAHGQGGHIVNTASIAGLYSSKNITCGAYCASKFGVVGLSEALRPELEPHDIGVSVLCPGMVDTQIAANVKRLRPVSVPRSAAARNTVQKLAVGGAERGIAPRKVGDFVLKSLGENPRYIITHPEFRPFVEERFAAVVAAFRDSADPGRPLSPNWMETA